MLKVAILNIIAILMITQASGQIKQRVCIPRVISISRSDTVETAISTIGYIPKTLGLGKDFVNQKHQDISQGLFAPIRCLTGPDLSKTERVIRNISYRVSIWLKKAFH
jgi:hypothetical protein